jgi:hypothetical protein
MFTWHIAQALALNQRMTYRQLAKRVLSCYDQLPVTAASPLFVGDGFDQWVGQDGALVRQ